jgi:tagaturonate reductase
MSEIYSLWAIEGGEEIKNILSFSKVDEGVVIESNIDLYRELKLRLLNGTHTLTCGLAFLAGFDTVQHAMEDVSFSTFIDDLMRNEIAPSIPFEIENSIKQSFISKVLDRFRNPNINHRWISITLNYTSKMGMRCIPLLINHYKKNDSVPPLFALGFAAYLYFMKPVKKSGLQFFGAIDGKEYLIEDPSAAIFYDFWNKDSVEEAVNEVLKQISIWGSDLSLLNGFQKAVTDNLNSIINKGMKANLETYYSKKTNA